MEEQVQAEHMTAPKKSNKTPLLVLLIFLLLISNIATAYFLFTKEEEVEQADETTLVQETEIPNEEAFLPEEEAEEIEMDIPELQSAQVGDAVNLGDYSVTIVQILDPNEDAPREAADGYRYAAIEVLLENNTDSTIYYYSSWTAYDTEGYDFSAFGHNYKTPSLSSSGSINVNGTTRGWVNFRLLEDAEISSIRFNETRENVSVDFMLETIQE